MIDPDANEWLAGITDLALGRWQSNPGASPPARGRGEVSKLWGHQALALLEEACRLLGYLPQDAGEPAVSPPAPSRPPSADELEAEARRNAAHRPEHRWRTLMAWARNATPAPPPPAAHSGRRLRRRTPDEVVDLVPLMESRVDLLGSPGFRARDYPGLRPEVSRGANDGWAAWHILRGRYGPCWPMRSGGRTPAPGRTRTLKAVATQVRSYILGQLAAAAHLSFDERVVCATLIERSTRTTEKRLAEKLARAWEDRAIEVANGLVDTRAESLAAHAAIPIDRHLDHFPVFLNNKGTEWKQIDLLESRITRVLGHIGAQRLSDLTASAVLSAISDFRRPGVLTPRGISAQTATHYIRTITEFGRWLLRNKHLADDQLVCLTTFNAEADRRRVRRDLSPEELARLIAAAESAPTVTVVRPVRQDGRRVETQVRMRLPDRAWAYRLAAATGFRASEVSTLTPESFDLDGDPPTATVEAGYSKRRRRDVQPLPRALVAPLRAWLANKPKGVPVCPLPSGKAALVLAADLAAARAAWLAEAPAPSRGARSA